MREEVSEEKKWLSTVNIKKIRFFQESGRVFLAPFLKFFTHFKSNSRVDLSGLKGPFIIAASHGSYLDPVVIGIALPKNCPIMPIFFITADYLLKKPFLGWLIKSSGAFPACKKQGYEKALEIPKQILAAGHSLVIFPQAHRLLEFKIEEGRIGTAMLALETGEPILPVGISGVCRIPLKDFFLRKCRVKVTVGEPFDLRQKLQSAGLAQDNLQEGTRIIMEEIRKLL
jgi:1-acyl-sn-glycerol-3-phosphate acyltransferase